MSETHQSIVVCIIVNIYIIVYYTKKSLENILYDSGPIREPGAEPLLKYYHSF